MGSKGGVRRNPNVLWRGETRGRDSKGIILFNYETRSIHFLEDLGKKIWEECQETDFENLIKKLGAEQERDQIAGFIKMLEERSLVSTTGEITGARARNSGEKKESGMWSGRVYFDAPLFVQFDCTNQCNLRCIHCVTRGGENLDSGLSTDNALNLIRELGALGVFQIGFSGGEPLIRSDIFKLMKEVKNQGMKLQLTTNATLVDDAVARKISELDPITVGVSLEGGTKESYEFFRGKGNFQRFVEGVLAMKREGLPIKFKSAILKKNLGEIEAIINLAMELGVEAVDMFLFYPQGRGEKLAEEALTPLEIKEFLSVLARKRIELEGTITIDVDDKPNAFLVDPTLSHSTCGAGAYWAEVLPNGDIVPCVFLKDVVSGNILDVDFKSAWDSKIWEPLRDRRKLGGRCGSCIHATRCGGGCRANGYNEVGDFLAEDTMCWI
jgi:radical SAM protein with 4Fe4S-binding SPASM domain